jgi:ferritin-like metal-binding protein YciE
MIILKLQNLFERDLEIIYDSECRMEKQLPKIISAVSSAELQAAFKSDLTQTADHLQRLKKIFASLDRLPTEESDHALKSIFHEGEKLIKNIDPSALLDSALIIFSSQVHHHKAALYESLWSVAQALGFSAAVDPLRQAASDEKASDEKLVQIGLQVNPAAVTVQNPPHEWEII